MKPARALRFGVVLITLLLAVHSPAQVTGTPAFGSFGGGPFDTINLGNLNVHFAVPVLHTAGRGVPFAYDLTYDSSVWLPISVNGQSTWQPAFNWGWLGQSGIQTGYVSYNVRTRNCDDSGPPYHQYSVYSGWVYHDPWGGSTSFSGTLEYDPEPCDQGTTSQFTAVATDGTGYTLTATLNGGGTVSSTTITAASGYVMNTPFNPNNGYTTYSAKNTDSNGNYISVDSSGVYTDTLNNLALTITGQQTQSSPLNLRYTGPSGAVSVVVNYTTQNVQTNFGCPGVVEYGPTLNPLVHDITFPDGSKYTFGYEPTPGYSGYVTGRLASVTLPTGGTITYTYRDGSNGIICADGSTAGFQRQTPDGTWTYDRSGAGTAWTTTITDPTPQANQTVLNFQSNSQGIYETERQAYQGASTGGTLLKTVVTCYNGNNSNCNNTAITLPITRRTAVIQLPGGLQSKTDSQYNTYELPTEVDAYDYGSGAPPATPLRKTLITYASLGNGIVDRPYTVTVQTGTGTILAQTIYTYDQGSVTTTSGTPQHSAVTGSRGNATTVQNWVQGSTYLTRTFTYFDTGNVQTATDVNNAQTTYTYNACGNSFPTSVSLPLGLSRSMVWNCTGGVQTSATDENSKTVSSAYNDLYFWRPYQTLDQLNNATNITYNSTTLNNIYMIFNNNGSINSNASTLDSSGRLHISQAQQGYASGSYDSVETDYNSLGLVSQVTLPYSADLGATCPGPVCPAVTKTYDALGRLTQLSDSGGGYTSYVYNNNDVLVTMGPAPSGENAKSRQLEYDALGRLTSVCELTTGAGSGTCGQSTTRTGFWTRYRYDAAGRLTGVCQNTTVPSGTDCVQAPSSNQQTRIYAYDALGRITSETTPEGGPVTYEYDSSTHACFGSYASHGDLLRIGKADGSSICMWYDSLHRVTDLGVWNGSPSWISGSCRRYRYDNSQGVTGTRPAGISPANSLARLAEAETDDCSVYPPTLGSIITDEWFSYSPRGETTDVWESTRNSGGYYHANATYWANGALNTLTSTGLPTFTYSADGEGRPSWVTASAGTNPVSNTAYNAASQPTVLTFGTGDTDTFTPDPNTGRMTQYQFTVGTTPQTVTGQLGWNPNGTLASLGISDQFNSANTQNCTYSYDDLGRIGGNPAGTAPYGVDCGVSKWQQYFTYDAFGNLKKNVPSGATGASFVVNYDTSKNQVGPGQGFTYDANGNTTQYLTHTYTWNVQGHLASVDGIALTYDALGRMVEQQNGSSYTQILYGPNGGKLALMNGQTLDKAFIPLPAGATAVYTSGSTLLYFRHADWLGSSRFASTPSRTMYSDLAYAPFGETYGEAGTADRSFTGQNQDTVPDSTAGLYDFMFREYAQYGRWISPDPAGTAAVDTTNPQTWNRYAYVLNNPAGLVDPLGLYTPGCLGDCQDFISSLPCFFSGIGCSYYPGRGPVYTVQDWLALRWNWLVTHGVLSPNPQAPAPNNGCSSALSAANRSAAGVARANAAWSVLQTAANANGIPTALLAATGVRETNFMNVQEYGGGPGMGVFQLTNQPGVSAAQAFNLSFSANYAAGMLSSNMNYLSGAFSFTPSQLLQATAASYNFGVGNISGNPNTIDVGTTGGNYGSTVVGIMSCFSHP